MMSIKAKPLQRELMRGETMRQVSVDQALARKYPELITLLVTTDEDGRSNIMPVSWCMDCSHTPPMMAVAIDTRRYTHHLIEERGQFVLAFPTPGMGSDIWYSGTHSGREGDKFAHLDLELSRAAEVNVPLVVGVVTNLECRLVKQMLTGDHTIFVGEIVAAHVDDEAPGRLLNFGPLGFALGQPVESTVFKPEV